MTQDVSQAASGSEPVLSWPAIIAGALVALATSIFLTLLAAGFGYALSANALASRHSLAAFTPEAGAAAVAIQVISAGLGGYLAGRLRHHWPSAHSDEAHFRDTAQGLVTWALAAVAGLWLSASVIWPYADQLAGVAAPPAVASGVLAQSAFFAAVGMILSAFIAAVAARIGGLRSEEMRLKSRD